jgi:hypothetical protein
MAGGSGRLGVGDNHHQLNQIKVAGEKRADPYIFLNRVQCFRNCRASTPVQWTLLVFSLFNEPMENVAKISKKFLSNALNIKVNPGLANLTERRELLRALQQYGEVLVFKSFVVIIPSV